MQNLILDFSGESLFDGRKNVFVNVLKKNFALAMTMSHRLYSCLGQDVLIRFM